MNEIDLSSMLVTSDVYGLNLMLSYDSYSKKFIGQFLDNYGHLRNIEENESLPQLLVQLNKTLG